MAVSDLEHVTRLADALAVPDKLRLIDHLSRQLHAACARGGVRHDKEGGKVWRSKFAPPVEDTEPREPGTEAAALQPRIAGLNAGEVWMSEDFNAELPDEFWFGTE